MAVRISKRSDADTNDKLISRFKKSIREARYVQILRKEKYHAKKRSKRLQKERALVRENFRTENKKKELSVA